jgi:hypothetical protein
LHGAPYRNTDFMRRYERDGVTVTVTAAERIQDVVMVSVD